MKMYSRNIKFFVVGFGVLHSGCYTREVVHERPDLAPVFRGDDQYLDRAVLHEPAACFIESPGYHGMEHVYEVP